jgi:hypothetical protein
MIRTAFPYRRKYITLIMRALLRIARRRERFIEGTRQYEEPEPSNRYTGATRSRRPFAMAENE